VPADVLCGTAQLEVGSAHVERHTHAKAVEQEITVEASVPQLIIERPDGGTIVEKQLVEAEIYLAIFSRSIFRSVRSTEVRACLAARLQNRSSSWAA